MKFKKTLSSILCIAMMSSCVSVANAETVTIENEGWNREIVGVDAQELYEEFPLIVDKTVGKNLDLTINMQYLKNISESDAVTVEIKDLDDNFVVEVYDLTADCSNIVWEDVENDKRFSITVNEEINGASREYVGILETKYVSAEFPVDMVIGNTEYNNNNGEEFDQVAIKKVGDEPVCTHDENEDCDEFCSVKSLIDIIMPDETDTFYSELDADCFYEVQVETTSDEGSGFYNGFISTYSDGEELGVFTRGYSFYSAEDEGAIGTASLNLGDTGISTMAVTASDYDFTTAEVYTKYINLEGSNLTSGKSYIVKWVVPETGDYMIETIGNVDTMMYKFIETDGVIQNTPSKVYRSGGVGENVRTTVSTHNGIYS